MKQIVVISAKPEDKIGPALKTLVSLIVIAALAYGAWVVIGKVLPVIGIAYLVLIGIFDFRTLIAKKKYTSEAAVSLEQTLRQSAKKVAEDSKGTDTETTEEQGMAFGYSIAVVAVLVIFFHTVITTILIFFFGTKFPGTILAYVGFALVLWNIGRLAWGVKNIFQVFANPDKPMPQHGKTMFWVMTLSDKAQSFVTLLFLFGLLAQSFGLLKL